MFVLDDDECLALLEVLWKNSITGYALAREDGRFIAANPAFCRMLEYTESELKNKRYQDITLPDDLAADEEMARLVAAGGCDSYDMAKGYLTKTRRHLPVLLRVTGVRMSGRFIFFVGEAAPIDRPPAASPESPPKARHGAFFRFLKDYWPQIGAAAGGLTWAVAKIIESLKGGGP